MSIIEQLAKTVLRRARVTEAKQIAAHTYHLQITDRGLRNLDFVAGQTLKVHIGLNDHKSVTEGDRKYSVWNYDAANGIIDLAVCTFSGGAGCEWIANRKKDDIIYFVGPSGRFTIEYNAQHYFFAGDITALAHFYQLNRVLKGKRVASLIHAANKEDAFADLDGSWPLDIQTSPNHAVKAVIQKIESTGFHQQKDDGLFYAAGSPEFCMELNQLFRRKYGWPVSAVRTKPFWKK
jgi:NADPH-dependent ferric siderophore reductase